MLNLKLAASQLCDTKKLGYIFKFPALPFHEYLRALGGVAVDGPVVVAVVVAHGDAEPSVICPHLRVE